MSHWLCSVLMFSSQHHPFHITLSITPMYCYLQPWAHLCVALRVPEAETEVGFAQRAPPQVRLAAHGAWLPLAWWRNYRPQGPGERTHTLTVTLTATVTLTQSQPQSHSHTHSRTLTLMHSHTLFPCVSPFTLSQPLLPGCSVEPVHLKSQSQAPTPTSKGPL